jgi:hypothetical protein
VNLRINFLIVNNIHLSSQTSELVGSFPEASASEASRVQKRSFASDGRLAALQSTHFPLENEHLRNGRVSVIRHANTAVSGASLSIDVQLVIYGE